MTIHSNLLLFPTMRFTSFFSAVGFFISRDHCDVRQIQLYIASRYQACNERLWLGHKAILPGIWPDIRFRLFPIGPEEVVIMGRYKETVRFTRGIAGAGYRLPLLATGWHGAAFLCPSRHRAAVYWVCTLGVQAL